MRGTAVQASSALPVTKTYLAACHTDPALVDLVSRIQLPPVYGRSLGSTQLPRPANRGVFVDEGGYNGAFVRALGPAEGSIVAYSNPGTCGACVFAAPPAGAAPGADAGDAR